jgi:hypothetical protein
MNFRPPLNSVIVQIKTKYIKNLSKVLRVAAIQQQSSIDPSDYCNIYGTVVSTPLEVAGWRDYKGYTADDIKVGDVAMFSSSVVAEMAQTDPEADPIFKNSFWWDGQEYWVCDITRIYAVVRAGEIRMQNGYVMVEHIEKQPNIFLPAHIKKSVRTTQAILTQIVNIDCKQGDTVFFNPNIITTYQIDDPTTKEPKEFGILQQKHVLGKAV